MEYVKPPPPWEAGRQAILDSTGARMPEHTFGQPVPVVVRIVWEHDGEEQIETEALGWSNGDARTADAPTAGGSSPPCGSTPRTFDGAEEPRAVDRSRRNCLLRRVPR